MRAWARRTSTFAVFNGAVHPAVVAQLPQHLIVEGNGPADVVLMFALNQKELEGSSTPSITDRCDLFRSLQLTKAREFQKRSPVQTCL